MRGKSQLFLRPGNLTQPPDAYYPFLYMQFRMLVFVFRMLVSEAFRDINMFSIEERGRYTTWAGMDDDKPTWSVSRRTTTLARRDDKVGNVARSALTSLLALALAAGYT